MKYLVVVDMQNDFIDGSLGSETAKEIVPRVADKVRSFDGKVLRTMDAHSDDYLQTQEGKNLPVLHCKWGSLGWMMNRLVYDALVYRVQHGNREPTQAFSKQGFGSLDLVKFMYEEELSEPIDEITLVGLCTDICVLSNAMLLKSAFPEVPIIVDASCCAGTSRDAHDNALKTMQQCQIIVENWSKSKECVYVLHSFWDSLDTEGNEVLAVYKNKQDAVRDMKRRAEDIKKEFPADYWEDDYTWEDDWEIHLGSTKGNSTYATTYCWTICKEVIID